MEVRKVIHIAEVKMNVIIMDCEVGKRKKKQLLICLELFTGFS